MTIENELLDRLKAVLQAKDEEIEALKLANKLQRERFDSTIAEIVDAQQRVHSLLTTLGQPTGQALQYPRASPIVF